MKQKDIFEKERQIFGGIFFAANKLQIIGDKHLNEITTKQWMMMVVIQKFGKNPPAISDVAKELGSSHQNVKQLAYKLEDKGFLKIEKDKTDSRVLRLKLTEKCDEYWKKRNAKDISFITELFDGMDENEINVFNDAMNKICCKIAEKEQILNE